MVWAVVLAVAASLLEEDIVVATGEVGGAVLRHIKKLICSKRLRDNEERYRSSKAYDT